MLLLFTGLIAKAQQTTVSTNNSLKTIVTTLNDYRSRLPVEKLYLQLDKPYYTSGDTLRFKAYLFNADYFTASTRSGLLYVELDDIAGKMVNRIMVPLASGISWGDMFLNDEDIPEGSYTLRAYTSWMLNFGEDEVFRKNIYISALNGNPALINTAFKIQDGIDKDKITAALKFSNFSGDMMRLKDMQLRVKAGNKTLFRDKAMTGMDGSMQFNFDLADKTAINKLTIYAQQRGKGADTATLAIPVVINRPYKTDLQFMPEGGSMVAGLPAKIGFKAIGEDGRGVDLSGRVNDNAGHEAAVFRSTHKGMGSFEFTPELGEIYSATIDLPGGGTKVYPLPMVNSVGTTLQVNTKGPDSLKIILSSSPDLVNSTGYYLIGQSRGVVCYGASVNFKNGSLKKIIAKEIFPTGIARFTLLTADEVPLNERIVYIQHDDNLHLDIITDKKTYTLRDSIDLQLLVSNEKGQPVQGTFSLAVTDDSQVRADSLGSNIINHLLFTSNLKGTVEEPGWYFENNADERSAALDNLLLTQGWTGYDWKQVFDIKAPELKYRAEKEFVVQGRLTNVFNQPIKKAKVSLLQKQPVFMMDTLTDDNGRFVFKNDELFPSDSTYYLVQVKTKKGQNRTMNVGVDIDEFTPPIFLPLKNRMLPWYVNTDTLLLNNAATKKAQLIAADNYVGNGRLLKEVNIKAKKIIKDSHNLNGPGESDFVMDEAEMFKARNMSLFEVLQKKYKDFHKITRAGRNTYFWDWHGNIIAGLWVDGVSVRSLYFPIDMYMEDILKASDIKGIEVMVQPRYAAIYSPRFYMPGMVFIEVTTYSGHGAFLSKTAGKSVYKAIPLILPKAFYRPRYTIEDKNIAMGTDLRSTIHWEPNLVTDTAGKATLSFFSADKYAGYTIIMEGTDLNGNIGYKRQKIKVAPKTIAAK